MILRQILIFKYFTNFYLKKNPHFTDIFLNIFKTHFQEFKYLNINFLNITVIIIKNAKGILLLQSLHVEIYHKKFDIFEHIQYRTTNNFIKKKQFIF